MNHRIPNHLILLLMCFFTHCAVQPEQSLSSEVLNGRAYSEVISDIKQKRSIVAIRTRKQAGVSQATGVLVADNLVLTALHAVSDKCEGHEPGCSFGLYHPQMPIKDASNISVSFDLNDNGYSDLVDTHNDDLPEGTLLPFGKAELKVVRLHLVEDYYPTYRPLFETKNLTQLYEQMDRVGATSDITGPDLVLLELEQGVSQQAYADHVLPIDIYDGELGVGERFEFAGRGFTQSSFERGAFQDFATDTSEEGQTVYLGGKIGYLYFGDSSIHETSYFYYKSFDNSIEWNASAISGDSGGPALAFIDGKVQVVALVKGGVFGQSNYFASLAPFFYEGSPFQALIEQHVSATPLSQTQDVKSDAKNPVQQPDYTQINRCHTLMEGLNISAGTGANIVTEIPGEAPGLFTSFEVETLARHHMWLILDGPYGWELSSDSQAAIDVIQGSQFIMPQQNAYIPESQETWSSWLPANETLEIQVVTEHDFVLCIEKV